MTKLRKALSVAVVAFLMLSSTFALTPLEAVASSDSLFLECEQEWSVGESASIEVWSVFAADVDNDSVVEILTCAEVNQSGGLRICSYNGSTVMLEHVELWLGEENVSTRLWSVFAADVDGDGVVEIITGGEAWNGQGSVYYNGQLRIWNWNGSVLTLEHGEEWHTGNNTHTYSVFADDVDGDGEVEIMTGGDAYDAGNNYVGELRVWCWNGSALTLEASEIWRTGNYAAVWSVSAEDVDGDSVTEIITSGNDGLDAQLRIWNWNGTALALEHSEEWTYTWTGRALSTFASDLDGDGNIEIITGGEVHAQFGSSWVGNGQLRVWNWNGSAITLADSVEWPLNGTYAYVWTVRPGDVDRDGATEILSAGSGGSGAQLRVWSFNGSALTLDANQDSADDWADTVFAFDVDGDGTTEILSAGYTWESEFPYTYIYEQLKIWSFPESTPPTIIIVSPENKTYSASTVPLTFNVDEPTVWIGYSLDGQMNETITGNITLPALPDDTYNIDVYANDTYGNMGKSSTVYFTVDTTEPNITNVFQDPPSNVLPDDVVRINVTVRDAGGINRVLLNYTYANSTGSWKSIANMTRLTGDIWNATIPALQYGTNVTYTIFAEDNVGNAITTEQLGYKYEYQVVPEFSTFPILMAFIVTTLLLAIISRKKRTFSA